MVREHFHILDNCLLDQQLALHEFEFSYEATMGFKSLPVMRRQNHISALYAIAICLLSIFSAYPKNLYTCDLDSLVEMSSNIVEGKIIGQYRTNDIDVWKLKISRSYFGETTAGQKIDVVSLGYYRVGTPWSFRDQDSHAPKKDDSLFLFIDRGFPTTYNRLPTNTKIYWPVESGVKFVSAGKAVGFWQYSNPGPYIADIERAKTNPSAPTVAELRRQIQESIKRVARWHDLLEKDASAVDIPALLDLLRERGNRNLEFSERDEICETVCAKLAALHEPDVILQACLLTRGGEFEYELLGKGLATPDGRKFLADKLASPKEALGDRLKWTSLIGDAVGFMGPVSFYRDRRWSPDQTKVNEHFLSRIAEISVNPQTETNLQAQLLQNLHQLAGIYSIGSNQLVSADGQEAESLIKDFWQNTKSEELKYAAETILFPLSRVETNSDFGPLIAILHPEPHPHSGRALGYYLEYISYQNYQHGYWASKMVLINLATGDKAKLPIPTKPIQGGIGGTSDMAEIPVDLPQGRYRAYLEFFDGDKVVATSHYFETDL